MVSDKLQFTVQELLDVSVFLQFNCHFIVQPWEKFILHFLFLFVSINTCGLQDSESISLDISEEILGEDSADQVLVGHDHLLPVLVLLGFFLLLLEKSLRSL